MNRYPCRLSFLIAALLLFVSSCKNREFPYSDFRGFTQGTTYSIIYQNNRKLDPRILQNEVEKILLDFDISLSLYQDSSIVSRINRNEDVIVDEYFSEVFRQSKEISSLTGGAFDVTIGPLVKAWGFGPDAQKNFTETKRDSLIRLVGMNKVELVDGRIVKADPGIILDFNAIAQGYSVDVIAGFFDEKKIDSYLIEIGGEVRTRGLRNGAYWRIGIDRPEDNNLIPGYNMQAVIRISDRSLATSGNYRKFIVEEGIKYSHTIDPVTGYPVRDRLLSVTIIAENCALADGIATACMVMGIERAQEFLKENLQFDAYLIFSDEAGNFRTWYTGNLGNYIAENP